MGAVEDKNVKYVIQTAIQKEKGAHEFYTDLSNVVEDAIVKDALLFLAGEKKKHEELLQQYLKGHYGAAALSLSDDIDYEIAKYAGMPDIEKGMEAKQVYLAATHRELNSYNFYKNLADMHHESGVKDLLLKMANQELKYKDKVE